MNFLKLKNILFRLTAVFTVTVLLTSFTVTNLKGEIPLEIANSLSWNNIPSSISNGNNKVKVNYSINGNGMVMVQVFNDKWDLIGQDIIVVSAGTGKLTLTLPAKNPSPIVNYMQAKLLNPSWEELTPKLEKTLTSSSMPPPQATSGNSLSWNVIPTNISNGNNRVKVNYSIDQSAILTVQVFNDKWELTGQVEEFVSAGEASQTLILPANGVSTSNNHIQAKLSNSSWGDIGIKPLHVKLP